MKTHRFPFRGLLFALPLFFCAPSPAMITPEQVLLDEFDFPGGNLADFVETYRLTAREKLGVPENLVPNIVVSPPAEARTVPAISVRSVSTEVLLQLVARLAGVEHGTIEPDREGSQEGASSPVHIFSVPEVHDPFASGGYGAGLSFSPSGGGGTAFGSGTAPSASVDFSGVQPDPFANPVAPQPNSPADPGLGLPPTPGGTAAPYPPTQPGPAQPPAGLPGMAGSMVLPGLPSPFSLSVDSEPQKPRFVIPMFTGFLFDESEEGLRKLDDLYKSLAEYLTEFFPDSGSELSMHRESGIVIVESSSQQAVDFVRAFLEARREAELFRLRKQQVDAGVRSAEILLEDGASNR